MVYLYKTLRCICIRKNMVPPPVKVWMRMRILTSVVMFYITLHSVICGCGYRCGYGCGPVYLGPQPGRHLFIYKVDKNTALNDLKDYIRENGFTVCDLECVSKSESKFLSFKLTVPISQFKCPFYPSLLPEGLRIRKFVLNKRHNSNASINPQQ